MDAVVQASFASLSLTAVVAHRLTAAAASGDGAKAAAAGVDRERDALKRKTYTSLRNRYFGAYFFAMFGITYNIMRVQCQWYIDGRPRDLEFVISI